MRGIRVDRAVSWSVGRRRAVGAMLVVAMAAPSLVRGADTAALWGAVVAPDGSRLPGAVVILEHRGGGEARVVAGVLGVYRVPDLTPGTWDITAESPGFAPAHLPDLVLAPGESRQQDLHLALAPLSEDVTVVSPPDADSLEAPAIRESGARDVGAALAVLPGAWSLRKAGIANDVVLRGLQSRDLSVMVDGDRVNGACPNHMDPPPFHVDFAEVERVQVSKGPFDVRNQGSLGGTVNITTRDPEPGVRFTPAMSVGSFGYINPSGTLSWAGDRAAVLAGFSWRGADADRDGDGLRFTQRANYRPEVWNARAFSVGTGWVRARYTPSVQTSLEATYTRQEARNVFYPYLMMDAGSDDTDRLSVRFESRRPPRHTITLITAQAYVSRVDHWMDDSHRLTSEGAPRGWSMGTQAEAVTWGGRFGGRIGRTTAGVEAYRRHWNAETLLRGRGYAPQHSIPGVDVDVVGLWAEYSRVLGDRLLLEAGGRYDVAHSLADASVANTDLAFAFLGTRSLSASDHLPSGKLRLAWRPVDTLQLSLAVGHTTRVPEASERYFALQRMGADWVGNPDLLPSRNTGIDAAVAWRNDAATVRASVFASRIDDYVTVREAER